MKQFTDEMLKEMLKMVDDPNYEPHMDEPTDEEINVMMPALFKEILAARKVVKIAHQLRRGEINMDKLATALMVYDAATDWDKFANGDDNE